MRVLAAAALATVTTALITWVDDDGAEDLPDLVDRASPLCAEGWAEAYLVPAARRGVHERTTHRA